jgi:hypothetical protein
MPTVRAMCPCAVAAAACTVTSTAVNGHTQEMV